MRGLIIPACKYHVKHSIQNNQTDVLMLQEVKVSDVRLDARLASIWPAGLFLHTNHADGGGGVVLGLAPWLAKHVVDSGSDPNHHCVWATTLINGMLVGFCSIYVPNSSLERTSLWEWLRYYLPNVDWVLGGDFNMVEHPSYRSWNSSTRLSHSEFEAWTLTRNSLGVHDSILGKTNLQMPHWFTWNNCREGALSKMSRLDHFYISPNCPILPSQAGHIVSLDLSAVLSDHLPIFTTLSLSSPTSLSNDLPFKLNVSHLKNQDCINGLLATWNAEPKPQQDRWICWWEQTITNCVSFLHDYGRRIAAKHQRLEKSLQGQLERDRTILATNPHNISVQQSVANAENALRKMAAYKGKGAQLRARLQWIKDGDRGTKFFFQYLKHKHKMEHISAIKSASGILQTSQTDIMQTFYEHFKNLFIDESANDTLLPILEEVVAGCIPRKIDPEYSKCLDHLLSIEELDEALQCMALEKSLGIDDLPVEFYSALWPHIREDFYYVYLEGIETGSLGPVIN
ncbi:uncharacterized protein LOC131079610 [Cryptomeria japonica]|uniref:uncharacterized protein LOC131079610 n=1 Tax=Cryptomeria japonica TaxID=3369 RepID=UPI0025AD2215|nr:uncharacterized protein LOC131079610 [Cryptomeria japonica]